MIKKQIIEQAEKGFRNTINRGQQDVKRSIGQITSLLNDIIDNGNETTILLKKICDKLDIEMKVEE